MTERAASERVSEVLRLCSALADRALDATILGRAVPQDQIIALGKAAQFLQDHGVEWPPLLTQVLHELADRGGDPATELQLEAAPLKEIDAQGLSKFFAALWREKGRP